MKELMYSLIIFGRGKKKKAPSVLQEPIKEQNDDNGLMWFISREFFSNASLIRDFPTKTVRAIQRKVVRFRIIYFKSIIGIRDCGYEIKYLNMYSVHYSKPRAWLVIRP